MIIFRFDMRPKTSKQTPPHDRIIRDLLKALRPLAFPLPVTHVYNPLEYAAAPHRLYLERYGRPVKEVVLLGMNPGPWGMAQTGVPFGEVGLVTSWLGIQAPVNQPLKVHPKRPVHGFSCPRSEVSGKRLWGWAKSRFGSPERFFDRFFVANYCPLVFMEASGKNRTPDNLPPEARTPLLAACDEALRQTIDLLRPRFVVGIGRFAADRARQALTGFTDVIGQATHPSPANPKANRGWEALFEHELEALGIRLPGSGENRT
ncbi:MAG: uracil-DNA glycosylase family protein [Thermodesulfobacteriota bacterium]